MLPARPVARPPAPVIPAARVLRHVAAQRPLVADLRRRHQFGRFHQQPEPLPHHRVPHHLGQRRQRADLQPAVDLLDPPQLRRSGSGRRPRSSASPGPSASRTCPARPPAPTRPTRADPAAPAHRHMLAGWNSSNAGITSRITAIRLSFEAGGSGLEAQSGLPDAIEPRVTEFPKCEPSALRACGCPFSSDVRIMSAVTGARRNTSSPTAAAIAFSDRAACRRRPAARRRRARRPAFPDRGCRPRRTCSLAGASRIVGGLL